VDEVNVRIKSLMLFPDENVLDASAIAENLILGSTASDCLG
jgi:hypothetical protein